METTQNVLAAITFELKFTYVLAGWEGSAHDARVLNDALSRPMGLKIPEDMGKGKNFRWSKLMSRNLLEILADEAKKGNKPSNTFKPSSFARVAKEISEKFAVDCHPKHVDNHLRTIKTAWNIIVRVRDNKSGFGWDDNLKMITCSKETYDQEIQSFPDHEPFLNKKIEMYDEMAIVVGKDMASGSFSKPFGVGEEEQNSARTEPTNLEMEDDDVSNGRQVSSSSISSKSRSHKKRDRVAAGLESNFAMIAQEMHNIADAIKEINVYSFVDELYEGVMKMEGFDEVQLASAFDYLMVNEKVARAFNKKSINLRRLWLEKFFNQHL